MLFRIDRHNFFELIDCFLIFDHLTLEGGLKSKKVRKQTPPKPPKTMGVLGGQWRKNQSCRSSPSRDNNISLIEGTLSV